MGPYIVLAFFAAQFIAYFAHSGLGEMLAISGGQILARADLLGSRCWSGFVGVVVMLANLFIGSMSAKYAFFAPGVRPHVHAGGHQPRAHPGRLPRRRLGLQRDHALNPTW